MKKVEAGEAAALSVASAERSVLCKAMREMESEHESGCAALMNQISLGSAAVAKAAADAESRLQLERSSHAHEVGKLANDLREEGKLARAMIEAKEDQLRALRLLLRQQGQGASRVAGAWGVDWDVRS